MRFLEKTSLGAYFRRIFEHHPDAARRFLEAIDKTVEGLVLQPLKA